MSESRALLRMARRAAWRDKARSALIIALITIPVAAAVGAAVLYRSEPLTRQQIADRALGYAAQTEIYSQSGHNLAQTPDGALSYSDGTERHPDPDLMTLLPAGSTITSRLRERLDAWAIVGQGEVRLMLGRLDASIASGRPAITLRSGRWATGFDEINLADTAAARAKARLGDEVVVDNGVGTKGRFRLVGIVHSPFHDLNDYGGVTPSTFDVAFPGTAVDAAEHGATEWIVSTPSPLTWSDVLRLNRSNLVVVSRSVILHPPPKSTVPYYNRYPSEPTQSSAPGTVTISVAAGLAAIQIALLCAPAFTVGARGRRRDIALLAAAGADRNALRRITLAEGLVLGATAAFAGVALGLAGAVAFRDITGYVVGPFRVHLEDLAAVVAIALTAALGGALQPACRAAGLDVVAALRGQPRDTSDKRRSWVLATSAMVVGALTSFTAVWQDSPLLLLPAIVLLEVGALALVPVLLSGLGLFAPRMSFAPRVVLRDAARNRGGATSTVAAILVATTACVAVAAYLSSLAARDEQMYSPQLRSQLLGVQVQSGADDAKLATIRTTIANTIPAARFYTAYACAYSCSRGLIIVPPAQACPAAPLAGDPRCDFGQYTNWLGNVSVLSPDELSLITGARVNPTIVAALNAGAALIGDRLLLTNNRLALSGGRGLPAVVWKPSKTKLFDVIISPATARALNLAITPVAVIASPRRPVTVAQQRALEPLLKSSVYVERGYQDQYKLAIEAIFAGAVVLSLAAGVIATGLSLHDSRAELATYWAIGAAPATRRRLGVVRAGILSATGVLAGAAIGVVPPWVVIELARREARRVVGPYWARFSPHPLSIPWIPGLLAMLVAVPAAAIALAAVSTRATPHTPFSRLAD